MIEAAVGPADVTDREVVFPPAHQRTVELGGHAAATAGVSRDASDSLCRHASANTPAEPIGCSCRSLHRQAAAFSALTSGRLPRPCFEACSAFTHVPACRLAESLAAHSIEGVGGFVTSSTAPIATGWSDSCQMGTIPAEYQLPSTAQVKETWCDALCRGRSARESYSFAPSTGRRISHPLAIKLCCFHRFVNAHQPIAFCVLFCTGGVLILNRPSLTLHCPKVQLDRLRCHGRECDFWP